MFGDSEGIAMPNFEEVRKFWLGGLVCLVCQFSEFLFGVGFLLCAKIPLFIIKKNLKSRKHNLLDPP